MQTNAADRRIGNVFGNGVYITTNIETALGYARVNPSSSTPNELGWLEAKESSIKVILACELIDATWWRLKEKPDWYVVRDQSYLQVRQVSLLASDVTAKDFRISETSLAPILYKSHWVGKKLASIFGGRS
jgi:hypothetical protein